MNIVEFPKIGVSDIPTGLRNLADLIEQGAQEGVILGISDAKTLVWVTVNEAGDLSIGALGHCPSRFHAKGIVAQAAASSETP